MQSGHWPKLQQGPVLSFWALMPVISPIREASAETRVAQRVPTLFSADPGRFCSGQAGGGRTVLGERTVLDKQEREEPPCTFMCISRVSAYGLGCVPADLPRLVDSGF